MRPFQSTCIAAILLCTPCQLLCGAPHSCPDTDPTACSESNLACGESCVYLLSRLLQPQKADKVLERMLRSPRQSAGHSLEDLQLLLAESGIKAVGYACDTEALSAISEPFIVHLFLDAANTQGHYVLAVPTGDAKNVTIYDPRLSLAGAGRLVQGSRFDRMYSGVVLVPSTATPDTQSRIFVIVVVAGLVVPMALVASKQWKSVQNSRMTGLRGGRLLLCSLITVGGCSPTPGEIHPLGVAEVDSQAGDDSGNSHNPFFLKKKSAQKLVADNGCLVFPEGLDVNLGKVEHSAYVEFSIPVKNCGDTAVYLSEIKNMLPCCFRGTVTAVPGVLVPGDRGMLNVKAFNGVRAGKVAKEARIAFLDLSRGEHRAEVLIRYAYETTGDPIVFRFTSAELRFGEVDIAKSKQDLELATELQVSVIDNDPPSVKLAHRGSPGLTMEANPPRKVATRSGAVVWEYKIKLKLVRELLETGRLAGALEASWEDSTISIPVTAKIGNLAQISPETELLIVQHGDKLLNNEIAINAMGGQQIDVSLDKDQTTRGLPVEVHQLTPRRYVIRVTAIPVHLSESSPLTIAMRLSSVDGASAEREVTVRCIQVAMPRSK